MGADDDVALADLKDAWGPLEPPQPPIDLGVPRPTPPEVLRAFPESEVLDSATAIAAARWSVTLDGKPAVEKHMDEHLKAAIEERESELKVMPTGWISFGSVKIAQRMESGFRGLADGRRVAAPAV